MNIRIKMIRNQSNPERTERSVEYPSIKINEKYTTSICMNRKRSKSEAVILKKEEESPRKLHIKREPLPLNLHIFSKSKSTSSSPDQKYSQKIKSQPVNQEKSTFLLKPIKLTEESEELTNDTEEINKFPHYVSKSNQIVSIKEKILEIKHRVKFNHSFPVLESIQDSINVNRACFTRKMKVEVNKKGNTSLNVQFEKDLTQYLEHESPEKFKSQEKRYRPIDLSYLMALQPKDENSFDKHQRVQKMEEIKKKLKAVRKTNFQRLK